MLTVLKSLLNSSNWEIIDWVSEFVVFTTSLILVFILLNLSVLTSVILPTTLSTSLSLICFFNKSLYFIDNSWFFNFSFSFSKNLIYLGFGKDNPAIEGEA